MTVCCKQLNRIVIALREQALTDASQKYKTTGDQDFFHKALFDKLISSCGVWHIILINGPKITGSG